MPQNCSGGPKNQPRRLRSHRGLLCPVETAGNRRHSGGRCRAGSRREVPAGRPARQLCEGSQPAGRRCFNSPIETALDYHASYSLNDRTRTFLKVQDGCDYPCAYCTIPLARGKSRSDSIDKRSPGSAGNWRIRMRSGNPVREIVLTGVNIGDFGHSGWHSARAVCRFGLGIWTRLIPSNDSAFRPSNPTCLLTRCIRVRSPFAAVCAPFSRTTAVGQQHGFEPDAPSVQTRTLRRPRSPD